MTAGRRLLRRIGTAAATLLLVTLTVFVLAHLAPGDPLDDDDRRIRRLTPEQRQELRELYRLDRPLALQYVAWLGDLVRGDLGRSFADRRPVAAKIGERIGLTLTLNLLALAVMVGLSVPLGAAAALRPASWLDRTTAGLTYGLYALPVFWGALLLQTLFAVRLEWLPLYGLGGAAGGGAVASLTERARHLVLPVACLSYAGLAYLTRFVRANLLEHARVESARAARARGLTRYGVLLRHGVRLSGIPMLTLAGFLLPGLVGGSVIVEVVFALPGLGRLFVDSVFQRDVPVLLGLTLLSGGATLAGIALADLAYAWADPRMARRG